MLAINFEKIILHNFLSYGHAEIDLANKHYCLVSGQNNNPNDNALSNGSGKSCLFSGICWALTGETIQGLSSNIKNIYVPENSCYVSLTFSINTDQYIIIRYREPKPYLSITVNGNDISGKGIRESEAILTKVLPDMSSQLLASIIILGQGLPCKFTDNSPSGRKEVLEKLSKSDYMIQDLKERVNVRSSYLSTELRKAEDSFLELSTKATLLNRQLIEDTEKLTELKNSKDTGKELEDLIEMENKLVASLSVGTDKISEYEEKISQINVSLSTLLTEKSKVIDDENKKFNIFSQEYQQRKVTVSAKISTLTAQIKKIDAIVDTCPTCGQKLPNINKPTCEDEKIKLLEATAELSALDNKYKSALIEHNSYMKEIDSTYEKDISEINNQLRINKQSLDLYTADRKLKEKNLLEVRSRKYKLESEQKSLADSVKTLETKLYNLNLEVKKLDEEILYINNRKEEISNHLNIITQMLTLLKRDFRGYLLTSIIDYIGVKAKEYALDIFGNDKLDFNLNGNNIEILYNDRFFENLSGGEKQKVDLIIQFAIRDMMRQYLEFSSNILVLDEIFDQLDAIGCTNVLNLISKKLVDIESIFIISHRAGELEIPYDCELIVIKDIEGVSSIKWQ